MRNDRAEALKEVMAADFTVLDLNLYLDTHPRDLKGIELFNTSVQSARILRKTYEEKYGPLTAASINKSCNFEWIDSPWPWE